MIDSTPTASPAERPAQTKTITDAAEGPGARPEDSHYSPVSLRARPYAEGGYSACRPAFAAVALSPFRYLSTLAPNGSYGDCYEAFNIQVDALMRRIQATGAKSLVIGISGGLDSTHALIVAAKACDRLGLPRTTIRGYTMPGFGTSDGTKDNAHQLMQAMEITADEIDIRPAATKMLEDIGHPFAAGEPVA